MKHTPTSAPRAASDAELSVLLQRVQEHDDTAALTELVQRTHRHVFRVAYRLVHDTCLAEDLTSEVFSIFVRRCGTIRHRDRILSWLHGVTLKCFRRHKANPREVLLPGDLIQELTDHQPGWDESRLLSAADLPQLSEALAAAIATLPERYRQCVTLLYLDGHSPKEVASLLAVSVETVHTYRCRALEELSKRKELREWL